MSKGAPRQGEGREPRGSVIIPAYRVTAFIADTLASVFDQTSTGYEVILVNDGCPDTEGPEKAIAPYRDRLRYIVQENGGPAKARNTAIRVSHSALIAQLDGDDRWFPASSRRRYGFSTSTGRGHRIFRFRLRRRSQ